MAQWSHGTGPFQILVGDRYDDGGFSGGTMERPALQRSHRRDLRAAQRVVRQRQPAIQNHHLDGAATLNILLSFAQFEREVIGEGSATSSPRHAARAHSAARLRRAGSKARRERDGGRAGRADLQALSACRLGDEVGAGAAARWAYDNYGRCRTAGTVRENRQVCHLQDLNNRVYLGEAIHKGGSERGRHPRPCRA